MRTTFRIAALLISVVATFYFVLWVGGSLLFGAASPFWRHQLLAVGASGLVAYLIWTLTSPAYRGVVRAIVVGAFVTGGIGFAVGFFGPMIFMPRANQGPLLGLFITGPLGFVLGAAGGGVAWLIKRRRVAGPARVPPNMRASSRLARRLASSLATVARSV